MWISGGNATPYSDYSSSALGLKWEHFLKAVIFSYSIQFNIICIAFLRYNLCKAALQEIKFLQYIYVL